jgi:hypothetical protein
MITLNIEGLNESGISFEIFDAERKNKFELHLSESLNEVDPFGLSSK